MTPKQITAAYRAALELSNIVLPYKEGRAVLNLKKRLAEEADIISACEKNMVKEYGGTVNADGRCNFPDEDTAQKFQAAREAWLEQEDEINLPKVDLSKHTNLIRITPAALEAMDGIVNFGEENTDG